MHEHAAVPRLAREAVLDLEAVVLERLVGDQVAARRAEADQLFLAHEEWLGGFGIVIQFRHIHVPAFQVGAGVLAAGTYGGRLAGLDVQPERSGDDKQEAEVVQERSHGAFVGTGGGGGAVSSGSSWLVAGSGRASAAALS